MENCYEDVPDYRTQEEIKRDLIFANIAIIIGIMVFFAGIVISIIFKNSDFVINIVSEGFVENCFFWTVYLVASFTSGALIVFWIKKIYIKTKNRRVSHV